MHSPILHFQPIPSGCQVCWQFLIAIGQVTNLHVRCAGNYLCSCRPMASWAQEAFGKSYLDSASDYFSLVTEKGGDPDYPPLEEWLHGATMPTPKLILDTFQQGFRSTFTLSGISDDDRCRREIQAVGCQSTFALDHHYALTKNYSGKERQKCKSGPYSDGGIRGGGMCCIGPFH